MVGRRHDADRRGFGSDNCSGAHPEVLAAIAVANDGHVPSYGADPYSEALHSLFRSHFGPDASAFPVFNGTGANVVALQAVTTRWASVVCTADAHIHVDECGAPEKVGGLKLLPVPAPHAKLTPELVETVVDGWLDDEHRARPQVLSVTQSTELGTLYTVDELRALCDLAHRLGMRVHMDGARISNAAVALDLPFRAFTTDVGVDVLSFGGTKNGLLFGEVVVVLDPGLTSAMPYVRKQNMQLGSKLRFVAAQFEALLADDLWRRNATQANQMAARLGAGLSAVPGVELSHPVEANGVFLRLPPDVVARLRERFELSVWDPRTGQVRLMTSFDTTPDEVDAFVAATAELVG